MSSRAAGSKGGTISIKDINSGKLFLIDSGADVSVFPLTLSPSSSASTGSLVAANGTKIKTFGFKMVELLFGSLSLSHRFQVADISKPILGSDFFAQHDLMIDVKNRRLVRPAGRGSAHDFVLSAVPADSGVIAGLKSVNFRR